MSRHECRTENSDLRRIDLATFGMLYGLYYALFVEHQTLDRMGSRSRPRLFMPPDGHLPEAESSLESYASTKYDYVRQVDVHSHWIGLAMLLILLGAIFDYVSFPVHLRLCIAVALVGGAVAFPLGVLLQTLSHGAFFASAKLSWVQPRSRLRSRCGLGFGCEGRQPGISTIVTQLLMVCNQIAIPRRAHWSLLKWIARRVMSSC